MRRFYSALSLLLMAVFFLQCQREVSYIGTPDNGGQIVTPDPISAALQGNIFDENGAPAAGVNVQAGNRTATTDAKGYFRINNAALDKSSAVVTATKAGYFKAYRTFGATSGNNHIEIKLVKKTSAGDINATTGGEVSLSNGTKVALPANGVVNAATNAAYTGQVTVYAAYIDPSAPDISQTVPGSFMATDKDGKRVVLTSYGMVAVELEGAAGEKLQIKSGATATLTTAIPAAAQASAPATIALWSVDETTGIWKEEGTATKNGNVYVGQVSHFSFWNCDVSQNAVKITVTLKLSHGEPFVHAQVRLKRTGAGWNNVSYGRTDSAGQVSGYVPYNEPLTLEILDRCGQPFYTQNIGPFTQNTNLGVITVANPGTAVVMLKGKLVNCSNSAVTNGYVIIGYDGYSRYVKANASGEFQSTFTRCNTSTGSFSIVGVDSVTQQQSASAVSVPVVVPLTDAGNVAACGQSASEFINYTLDGVSYALISPADSLMASTSSQGSTITYTSIFGWRANSTTSITFNFQSPTPAAGTYQVGYLSVNNLDSIRITTPINIAITNFPTTIGGFYEGNFNGTFNDVSNVSHTINASFRVRRK
jgi:hypothetical protein